MLMNPEDEGAVLELDGHEYCELMYSFRPEHLLSLRQPKRPGLL